ncbi:MAG: hypothetical protein ACYDAY_08610 [Candidatus Dormibacteria bacterium]
MKWSKTVMMGVMALGMSLAGAGTPAAVLAHSAADDHNNADTCSYTSGFNESTLLRDAELVGSGSNLAIAVFASDEASILLGMAGSGGAPTLFTPASATAPYNHANNPSLGDLAATDSSGRPLYPVLYLTDTTLFPGSHAGDWQSGGAPTTAVSAIFGTWTTAAIVNGHYRAVRPRTQNHMDLGPGADTPSQMTANGDMQYGTEVRWSLSSLGLVAGHTYRIQTILHDGDQNKSGGDAGEACVALTIPGTPVTPSPSPSPNPSPSPQASPSPSPSPIASPTPTPSPSPSSSPSPSATPSPSPTPAVSPAATPTPSPSAASAVLAATRSSNLPNTSAAPPAGGTAAIVLAMLLALFLPGIAIFASRRRNRTVIQ